MNSNIQSYSDLEREEIRVRRRIKKQEELLKVRLNMLPEEIVKTGASKIVSSVLNGDIFKTAFSIIKTVTGTFSEIKKEKNHSGGILNMIKNLVKDSLSK